MAQGVKKSSVKLENEHSPHIDTRTSCVKIALCTSSRHASSTSVGTWTKAQPGAISGQTTCQLSSEAC